MCTINQNTELLLTLTKACTEPIVLILKQEYKVRLSAVEGSQSINRICYITLTCILSSDKQNAVSLHKNQYACLQKLTKALLFKNQIKGEDYLKCLHLHPGESYSFGACCIRRDYYPSPIERINHFTFGYLKQSNEMQSSKSLKIPISLYFLSNLKQFLYLVTKVMS